MDIISQFQWATDASTASVDLLLRVSRGCSKVWSLGSFSGPGVGWQNFVPCGCRTEDAVFLLAISWGLLSALQAASVPARGFLVGSLSTWLLTSSKPAGESLLQSAKMDY